MSIELLLILLLVGVISGIAAGLLGVGGGLIIVPALLWVLAHAGFESAWLMHVAVGTSLATIVLTSISSSYSHHRLQHIRWEVFWRLLPGLLLGGLAGAEIAARMDGQLLKTVFALFLIVVATRMMFARTYSGHHALPGRVGMSVAGSIIGGVSALVGIGGGTLTVPFLAYCAVKIKQAVGTSAAAGLPIALAGTIGFVLNGWSVEELPPGSFGYVYLPAFGLISVSSVLFAPFGACLANALPVAVLKRIFACLMYLVAGKLLWGVFM